MQNMAVRTALKKNNVKAWELAEELGIVDCTLSKWMRRELPEERQEQMIAAIKKIANQKRESVEVCKK